MTAASMVAKAMPRSRAADCGRGFLCAARKRSEGATSASALALHPACSGCSSRVAGSVESPPPHLEEEEEEPRPASRERTFDLLLRHLAEPRNAACDVCSERLEHPLCRRCQRDRRRRRSSDPFMNTGRFKRVLTFEENEELLRLLAKGQHLTPDEQLLESPGPGPQLQPPQDQQAASSDATKKKSRWSKLRNIVQWPPFTQTYKNRRYQWVQLAGHSGNFKAGHDQGTVLKKFCPQEELCYNQFASDALAEFVPHYLGTLEVHSADNDEPEKFIQLEDCLSSFTSPSIMDCKIGVRTYLEEELSKAKEKPKLRKDMYDKMVAVDPTAPSEEEHRLKGVTKPRYMLWRETISSTATLGFRVEGIKMSDGSSTKDFKTTKTRQQVLGTFRRFIAGSDIAAAQYLERLRKIKAALEESDFFRTHELIGSSLLFVHDASKASIWMIDFGKTVGVPDGVRIDHKSPWEVGNHEDGYMIAIDNLIDIFGELMPSAEDSQL